VTCGGMKLISMATSIAMTSEERQALELLVGSRKRGPDARLVRIVLLAAAGLASRATGREGRLHSRHGREVAGQLRA
jgi:hypothetical protein